MNELTDVTCSADAEPSKRCPKCGSDEIYTVVGPYYDTATMLPEIKERCDACGHEMAALESCTAKEKR